MKIQTYNLFLSTLLIGITSMCPPTEDSYIISIPQHIELDSSGQFNISLVESNISENDTIEINFDDSFTLTDTHGKGSINGRITNGNISFSNNDISSKTIYYDVDDAGVGDWRGALNVSISMSSVEEELGSSSLIDGPSINAILKDINPTSIVFTHDYYDGDYLYDLSSDNDGSIIMFMDGAVCIITNKKDKPIVCGENMSHMFEGLSNCVSITGLEYLDVSNVTDFSYLFYGDTNLNSVPNIEGWSVSDKCTNLSYMLSNICYSPSVLDSSKWPESFDLSGWNVSNVVDMSYMFENAFGLKTLNLSGWNTSNLDSMEAMFKMKDSKEVSKLERIIGIENFDASNISTLSYTFYDCRYLSADNDFSSWAPTSLTDLSYTFYNTKSLDLTDFENWNQYFNVSTRKMKQCFGSNSGYYVDQNYRPSWYK